VTSPPTSQASNPATMNIGFRTVDDVRIRYAESDGPADRTIVLTSPWPESIYAFAPVWSALASRFRLFAVDLPGFGASEQPHDLLSPKAMGAFLVRLITECDLGRPHIVGPDVGTSAALFATAAHPERIASVIVGSGGTAVPIQLGDPLASWVLDPDLEVSRGTAPACRAAASDHHSGHDHRRPPRPRRPACQR